MRRALPIAAGLLVALIWGAPSIAQQPAKPVASPPAAAKASPARKQPTSYAQCNAAARQNGLRGAQRRRFIARCQLGYETPVFKP